MNWHKLKNNLLLYMLSYQLNMKSSTKISLFITKS